MALTAMLIVLAAPAAGSASQAAAGETGSGHRAEIRRTAHGIPHVKADGTGASDSATAQGLLIASRSRCERLSYEALTSLTIDAQTGELRSSPTGTRAR